MFLFLRILQSDIFRLKGKIGGSVLFALMFSFSFSSFAQYEIEGGPSNFSGNPTTYNEFESITSATSGVQNPAMQQGGTVANIALSVLNRQQPQSQGLQFKDPILTPDFTYRNYHDSSTPDGFGGHEYGGDVAFDADIYDGYILGLMYLYTDRNGHNSTGSVEHFNANGASLYAAKRYMDLINAGAAFNFVTVDHALDGTVVANLDRQSYGFTTFLGVSDKVDKWFWSTTGLFAFANDQYEVQSNLDTGLFTWINEVDYDITDIFTLGFAFSYNRFVIQDVFPGVTAVDDDYWMVGPRFRFYPTDDITVNVDLDTEEGYTGYNQYTVRVGCNYAF